MYKYVELSIADTAEVPAVACYRLKDQVQGEGIQECHGGGGAQTICERMHITSAKPLSLTAGVQGSKFGPGLS